MFVKKGDKVKVITGKDKNKEGVVLAALPKKDKVIVEGVNIVKKHQKPSQAAPQGGIVEVEAPIHVSNVMVIDPSNGQPTKVAYKEGANADSAAVQAALEQVQAAKAALNGDSNLANAKQAAQDAIDKLNN